MTPPVPTPPPQLHARAANATVLPLTTIFTPPQSCFNAPFTLDTSTSGNVGFSTAWRDYDEASSQCYPPNFSSLQWDFSWYSPGVCASGYDIAQTSILTGSVDVTQAWCCPSGFTITGFLSSGGTYQACSALASNAAVITLSGSTQFTVTPSLSFIGIQWPISVEWASTDLSLFQPASAPLLDNGVTSTISSFTGTAATTGTHEHEVTSSESTKATSSGPGLSRGAEAGIAVGVIAAAIATFASLLVWIFRRRRSRKRMLNGFDKGERPFYVDNKIELPNEELRRIEPLQPVELNALNQSPRELDAEEAAKKSHDKQRPVELDGSQPRNEPLA